jgi:hypothetical protein
MAKATIKNQAALLEVGSEMVARAGRDAAPRMTDTAFTINRAFSGCCQPV